MTFDMRRPLKRHPDSHGIAASQIDVEIRRPSTDRLVLLYTLAGKLDDIRIPSVVPPARGDELWRHTCFEAFVRASSGEDYYEFNFAPSTQWAAYWFSGYRSGMRVAAEIGAPSIEVQSNPDRFTLQASLGLDDLSDLPPKALWHLGLSAVIEDASGRMSYWALAHAPGTKPDFHHVDCFAYEFSPP